MLTPTGQTRSRFGDCSLEWQCPLFDAPQAVDFLAGRPSSRQVQDSNGAEGWSKARSREQSHAQPVLTGEHGEHLAF